MLTDISWSATEPSPMSPEPPIRHRSCPVTELTFESPEPLILSSLIPPSWPASMSPEPLIEIFALFAETNAMSPEPLTVQVRFPASVSSISPEPLTDTLLDWKDGSQVKSPEPLTLASSSTPWVKPVQMSMVFFGTAKEPAHTLVGLGYKL